MAGALSKIKKIGKAAEKAKGLGEKAADIKLSGGPKSARDKAIIEASESSKQGFLGPSAVKSRVYHATDKDFSKFNPRLLGEKRGAGTDKVGFWFGDTPESTEFYIHDPSFQADFVEGANIVPAHLQLKNPYRMDAEEFYSLSKKDVEAGERLKANLQKQGFDGVIAETGDGDAYAVFEPTQIKSAIGMKGSYDTTDPDITKAAGGKVDHKLKEWFAAQGGITPDPYQRQQQRQATKLKEIQEYKEGKIGADELLEYYPGLTATMIEAQLNPQEGMAAGGEVRMQAGGGQDEIRRQLAGGVPVFMAPGSQGDIARQMIAQEEAERKRKEEEQAAKVASLPFMDKLRGGVETAQTIQNILGQEVVKPFRALVGGEEAVKAAEERTPLPETEAGVQYLKNVGEFLSPIGQAIEQSKIPDVPFLPELGPVTFVPGMGRQIGNILQKTAAKADEAVPAAVKNLPVGASTEPVGKTVTEVLEGAPEAKAKPGKPEVVKAPANELGFYSQAEKAALNIQRKQGPGDAFLSELKKAGVSQDELEYTKLNEFLKGKKNVTKQELQDYIGANKYRMSEIEYKQGEYSDDGFSFGSGQVIDDDVWINEEADHIYNTFDEYFPERRQEIRDEITAKYDLEELDDPTIRNRIDDEVDQEIRQLADEDARARYYENPYRSYTNDAGYEINGNDDVGYTVLDPNGRRIGNDYYDDFESAEGDARQHAMDEGLLDTGETKFHDYQLPNGENYREILIQMEPMGAPRLTKGERARFEDLHRRNVDFISNSKPPLTPEESAELQDLRAKIKLMNERDEYNSNPHFDEPDVIAHLRVQDRTTVDRKPMLYVDELQSDWHQYGGEYGYRTPENKGRYEELNKAYYDARDAAARAQEELNLYRNQKMVEINNAILTTGNQNYVSSSQINGILKDDPKFRELADRYESFKKIERDAADEVSNFSNIVPDAPYKDNWHALGIKRALNYAAEKGYDRVGFSAASPQIKRWGTEEIAWEKSPKIDFNKENFISWARQNSGDAISEDTLNQAWNFSDEAGRLHPLKQDFKNLAEKPEGWDVSAVEQRGGMAGRIDLEAEARARGILQEREPTRIQSKEDLRKIIKSISRRWSKSKIDRITEKTWKRMQQDDTGIVAPREEGMKFFYDNKVKNFLKDYAKKMGGEFYESHTFIGRGQTEPVYIIELTPKLKESALKGQSFKKGGLVEVDPKLKAWGKKFAKGGIAGKVAKAATKASKRMSREEAEKAGLWHSISETKLAKPVTEYKTTVVEDPSVEMLPRKSISLEELQGGVAIPLAGDRAAAGRLIKEIEGTPMNVALEGGPDFMRLHPGAAWASGQGVLSMLAKRIKMARESGQPIYGVYTAMSPQAVDFNTMVTESLLNQMDVKDFKKKDIQEFNRAVKAVKGQGGKPKAPNFPGLEDPELREKLMSGPGGQRDAFVKAMAKANFQKKGFPDVAAARLAVTEPELLNIERGSAGYTVAKLDPEARIFEQSGHTTYPLDLGGEYVGGFESQLPVEVMYPTHFEAKRLMGSKPEGAHKSLELFAPLQYMDQQWLDNAMRYQELQKKLTGRKKGGLARVKN